MIAAVNANAVVMSADPVLIAYGVRRSKDGKKNIWTRCGEAYPHEVGSGLTVVLDVIPREGRIVLLEPNAYDDDRLQERLTLQSKSAPKPLK